MSRRSFRARYENGVLTPIEPLELSEGSEVTVEVSIDYEGGDTTAPVQTAKSGVLEIIDDVHREFPDAFTGMPHDGAKQYKHYLYGHPRDED